MEAGLEVVVGEVAHGDGVDAFVSTVDCPSGRKRFTELLARRLVLF